MHLQPTAAIAPDALLPGDPKRAMELAGRLMERPLMSNLSRGLWGYHGHRADGRELTVQSTGIGGPSAAVVLAELAELGVRRAIRVGTCTALDPDLAAGETIVVDAALAGDGVGSALGEGAPERSDPTLSSRLVDGLGSSRVGLVASTDLYYDPDAGRRRRWREAGALAVELSSAALFAVGRRAGVAVGCALVVAESADGKRLTGEGLDAAALELGQGAAAALLGTAQPEALGSDASRS